MIEIVYRKGIVRIDHVWFANSADQSDGLKAAGIYFFHGIKDKPRGGGVIRVSRNDTLINDLSAGEEALWRKISESYRNEIKRADRDGAEVRCFSSQEILQNRALIDAFQGTYQSMFQTKGMEVAFNRKLFEHYAAANALFVTVAFLSGAPAVFHSYLVDGAHARIWYSCSDFRKEPEQAKSIGRLNRHLHWSDFLRLKEMGVTEYDWGGINHENPAVAGITEFKRRFGGEEELHYDVIAARNRAVRLVGRIALRLLSK